MYLLQDEMLEQQAPDRVEPANENAEEGDDEADDEAQSAALLEESAPSDKDLGDPVDDGDEKQDDLNQAALFVEPGHVCDLLS